MRNQMLVTAVAAAMFAGCGAEPELARARTRSFDAGSGSFHAHT